MADLAYIQSLPKAELHLHLEGSVDPATLAELSRRHNTPLPMDGNNYAHSPESGRELSEDDVRALYRYKNFVGFLMAFKAVTERLRTPEDYELISYRLMQKLASQNVLHAEVYVSVGVILWRGQQFDRIFEGLERGRERGQRDFGVSWYWIFDAVRHFGVDAARRVFETAVEYRDRNVIGIGIGGDEKRGPAQWFGDLYAEAGKHGLRLTAHAGESSGADSVRAAIEVLGAERIGHGVTAIQDPGLVEQIVQRQIPIEICVSSNLRTGCCASAQQHPLRRYFDAGALVTLNTDDPEMFGTTLNGEFAIAADRFGFSREDLWRVAANSFKASFLPEEQKAGFLARLEASAIVGS